MCHVANQRKTKSSMRSYEKLCSLGGNVNKFGISIPLLNHYSDDSLCRTAIVYVNTLVSFMYQGICILFQFQLPLLGQQPSYYSSPKEISRFRHCPFRQLTGPVHNAFDMTDDKVGMAGYLRNTPASDSSCQRRSTETLCISFWPGCLLPSLEGMGGKHRTNLDRKWNQWNPLPGSHSLDRFTQ